MIEHYQTWIDELFTRADGAFGTAKDYFAALKNPPQRGLRFNALKTDRANFLAHIPFSVLPTPFAPDGFLLPTSECAQFSYGRHPYHAAGLYYMQEPSAMLAAAVLIPYLPKNAKVLDLCAAPGGKTTQLLSALNGSGALLANEFVFSRAKILLSNVERMGARNCAVTCLRPDALAAAMPDTFDAVVADVPCSGEGMLRKEADAATHWNEKNVAACAIRGREILSSAMKLLRKGGYLLYSTCTLNTQENEEQIAHLLRTYPCRIVPPPTELAAACDRGLPPITDALRVFPHRSQGEGHFVCLLQKTDGTNARDPIKQALNLSENPINADRTAQTKATDVRNRNKKTAQTHPKSTRPIEKDTLARICDTEQIFRDLTTEPLWASIYRHGDTFCLVPDALKLFNEFFASGLPFLRIGVAAAYLNGAHLMPHHQLCMAMQSDKAREPLCFSPQDETLAKYLLGESFACQNAATGSRSVQVDGFNLGWVKVVDGTAKNHYPKGLRFSCLA